MQFVYSNVQLLLSELFKIYFPFVFVTETTKISMCIALSSLCASGMIGGITKCKTVLCKTFKSSWYHTNYLIITNDAPEFSTFINYVTEKYKEDISGVLLNDSKVNTIDFKNKELIDVFKNHKITIKFEDDNGSTKLENKKNKYDYNDKNPLLIKNLIITSKSATTDNLKTYVDDMIYKFIYKELNNICIHTINKQSGRNGSILNWIKDVSKTNRNNTNTFFSDQVNEEFIEDIRTFLDSQSFYNKKGIPYKKGYLMYGFPGCGKSTLIKMISSEFRLPIFTMDCSMFDDNNQFVKITSNIKILVKNGMHIVLFEDFDRFLKSKNSSNVSQDSILNFLDGIEEAHGRIVIITTNDKTTVCNIPSLVRPGRIDKVINIPRCSLEQIRRTIDFYYEEEENSNEDKIDVKIDVNIKITTAQLMQLLQTCDTKLKLIKVINNASDFSNNDAIDASIYKKITENKFDEQSVIDIPFPNEGSEEKDEVRNGEQEGKAVEENIPIKRINGDGDKTSTSTNTSKEDNIKYLKNRMKNMQDSIRDYDDKTEEELIRQEKKKLSLKLLAIKLKKTETKE